MLCAGHAYATVTILLDEGVSFQDDEYEPTTDPPTTSPPQQFDDTAKLLYQDFDKAPTYATLPWVNSGYYASGTAYWWFDAISANFDLSSVGHSNIYKLTFKAWIRTGQYFRPNWHHYAFYPGAFNPTREDDSPVMPARGTMAFRASANSRAD